MKALLTSDRAVRRRENYQKDKRALRVAIKERKLYKPVWEPHARQNPRLALSCFGVAGERGWQPGMQLREREEGPCKVRGVAGSGKALGAGRKVVRKGSSAIEVLKSTGEAGENNYDLLRQERTTPVKRIHLLARQEQAKVALVRGQTRL